MRRPLGLALAHIGFIFIIIGGLGLSSYYVLGIWEGQSADRLFYNNRWELVLEPASALDENPFNRDSSVRDSYSLGRLGATFLRGREIGLRLNQTANEREDDSPTFPDIRIIVDEFFVNARPDSSVARGYVEARWEDSPSANLPLLRGSLFVGPDSRAIAVEVWAGNPLGLEFPISLDGRLSSLSLRLEPLSRSLPFLITLNKFRAEFHPGTGIPRSFTSTVLIEDAVKLERAISMNRPLRYRGFVFYQDSYQADEQGRMASIFSVRETNRPILQYIGTALSFLGFLLHYFTRKGGHLTRRTVTQGPRTPRGTE